MCGARNKFARVRIHLHMRQAAIAMEKGNLINELIVSLAKSCRQGLSLAERSGGLERHKRLDQSVGLHLFPRFSRVKANWFEARLDFCGSRLTARQREAVDSYETDGDRNHDDKDGRETQVVALVGKGRSLPNNVGPNI
jgi:hypothetical protein